MKKKPGPKYITREEVARLLAEPGWTEDARLASEIAFAWSRLYRHRDGRLLLVDLPPNPGVLWDSVDDALRLVRNAPTGTQHFLRGRLPYKRRFAEKAPQLVEQLARKMKVPPAALDRSVESLFKVDEFISRVGWGEVLDRPLFARLVAYTGQVLANITNGRWEMRLVEENPETWEPLIVSDRGAEFSPGSMVYDALDEDGSIAANAIGALAVAGYPRGGQK